MIVSPSRSACAVRAGAVRHRRLATDGEDGAFGVVRPALGQPQVDLSLHLADGERVAVRLDHHLVLNPVRGDEIRGLAPPRTR